MFVCMYVCMYVCMPGHLFHTVGVCVCRCYRCMACAADIVCERCACLYVRISCINTCINERHTYMYTCTYIHTKDTIHTDSHKWIHVYNSELSLERSRQHILILRFTNSNSHSKPALISRNYILQFDLPAVIEVGTYTVTATVRHRSGDLHGHGHGTS